jgi:putative ABC transport system permease protein
MRRRARLSCIPILLALVSAPRTAAQPHAAAPLPDVLVADRTARALGLATGDTLDIAADASMRAARAFRIAGIYRPQADPYEVGTGRLGLRMHLPDLAALQQSDDRADRFVLRLKPGADRDAALAALDASGIGLRAYGSDDLARRASSTFVVVSQFHKAIGLVSLLAGLVFLAALLVLEFEALRRELAALRLLGVSRRTVLRMVVAIAIVVAVAGSVLGIGLGATAIAVINPLARLRYDTDLVFARLDPGIVALAVGLSIGLGVVAGLAVAVRHARGDFLRQIGR